MNSTFYGEQYYIYIYTLYCIIVMTKGILLWIRLLIHFFSSFSFICLYFFSSLFCILFDFIALKCLFVVSYCTLDMFGEWRRDEVDFFIFQFYADECFVPLSQCFFLQLNSTFYYKNKNNSTLNGFAPLLNE